MGSVIVFYYQSVCKIGHTNQQKILMPKPLRHLVAIRLHHQVSLLSEGFISTQMEGWALLRVYFWIV